MHRRRQRLHFGVRRGVPERLDEVVAPSHDAAVRHDDGTYGHLFPT